MNQPANNHRHFAARIEAIAGPLVGRLGFSAQRLDGGPVIALNADERFPMASIFKISDRARCLYEEQLDPGGRPRPRHRRDGARALRPFRDMMRAFTANLRPRTAVPGRLRRTLL
jgi:hypothetical protein